MQIVQDAKLAAQKIKNGAPIESIILSHPMSYFNSHTVAVWQSCFEDNEDCYKTLERYNIYNLFKVSDEVSTHGKAMLAITILDNREEANFGLSTKEAAEIIYDCLHTPEFCKVIIQQANENIASRQKICSEYNKQFQNPQWIQNAINVKNTITKLFGGEKNHD